MTGRFGGIPSDPKRRELGGPRAGAGAGGAGGLCRLGAARKLAGAVLIAAAGLISVPAATAQELNPVYMDTEPRATDTLAALPGLIRAENLGEAVRAIQALLDELPHTVIPDRGDGELFVPLDARLHAELLSEPALLARYRLDEGARAQRQLDRGEHHDVGRSRLLTEAGFEATLRVAQEEMEAARFASAWLALRRLEPHPDRLATPDNADAAARTAALVASYLVGRPAPPGERPSIVAARWAEQAGREMPPLRRPDVPEEAERRQVWAFDTGADADLRGLSEDPLASAEVFEPTTTPRELNQQRRLGQWLIPSMHGDLVLLNDGSRVRAWDRFTLTPVWEAIPGGVTDIVPERFAGRGLNTQPETAAVAVAEGIAVAITGLAPQRDISREVRLSAIDADTGEILWSFDPAETSPELEEAMMAGPPEISEGVVVVSMRRAVRGRRLQSTYLAGFDLQTGAQLWVQLSGSAGALPYQRGVSASPTVVVSGGVAYRVDPLGVISAMEAATGRPLWARRDPLPGNYQGNSDDGWEGSRPVVVGDRVVCLSPDRRRLLEIDARTGEIEGQRLAVQMQSPRYLVRVGSWIAAVGASHAAFVPLDDPIRAEPVIAPFTGANPPRGRAVAVGDLLFVPLTRGAVLVDPARPRAGREYEGVAPGNLVAVDGQVVAAGPQGISSYLSWEVARGELRSRLEADPTNPEAPITLARLAHRTGRDRMIAPAIDAALEAAAATGPEATTRVFDVIREIVEPSLADEADRGTARAIADAGLVGQLVDRMLRAASGPEQLAASLLALGRQREIERREGEAVEAYQQLVQDVDLAAAQWSAPGGTGLAGGEATRRLLGLIATRGAAIYDPYEAEARLELDLLDPGAGAGAYEDLASRYPASAFAPGWWTRAGELHLRALRPVQASLAFAKAEATESASRRAGRVHPPEESAERIGLWAEALVLSSRPELAVVLLDRVRGSGVPPRINGSIEAAAALRERAMEKAEAFGRLANTGPAFAADRVRVAPGHRLLEPMLAGPTGVRADSAITFDASTGQLWYWHGGVDGASPAWSKPFGSGVNVRLVRQDPEAVFLLVDRDAGAELVRLEAGGGAQTWSAGPVESLLPERQPIPHERVTLPRAGVREARELVAVADRATLALIERTGRAVAVDLLSGRVLWSSRIPLGVVTDADARRDTLSVVGRVTADEARPDEAAQAFALFDMRTGRITRPPMLLEQVAIFTRVGEGVAIVGTQDELHGFDLGTGARLWQITEPDIRNPRSAVLFGERALVQAGARGLALVDIARGRTVIRDMEPEGRVAPNTPMRVTAVGRGANVRYYFATPDGFVGFSAGGNRIAIDVIEDAGPFLPGTLGDKHTAFVSANPVRGEGGDLYLAYVVETASGRLASDPIGLLLEGQPETARQIDGALLIGTTEGVSMIPMPPEL